MPSSDEDLAGSDLDEVSVHPPPGKKRKKKKAGGCRLSMSQESHSIKCRKDGGVTVQCKIQFPPAFFDDIAKDVAFTVTKNVVGRYNARYDP